jgi:hypothetical protein
MTGPKMVPRLSEPPTWSPTSEPPGTGSDLDVLSQAKAIKALSEPSGNQFPSQAVPRFPTIGGNREPDRFPNPPRNHSLT